MPHKTKAARKAYLSRPEVRRSIRKRMRGYVARNRAKINDQKRRQWRRAYWQKNHKALKAYSKERARKLRREILALYGGKCECCGEDRFEFLAIDHKKGGGSKERRSSSRSRYLWRLKGKRSPKYRVLCHNCNSALGFYGYCPHAMHNPSGSNG